MSLSSAGVTALRSLGVISDQISLTSRNIAGAGVAGVSEKTARLATGNSGLEFLGVSRAANIALFRNLLSASSQQENAKAVADTLSRLDLALGLSDASSSRSPAIQISRLSDALRTYSASPQDQTSAQIALSIAQDIVNTLHEASAAVQDERRNADQTIAKDVADVNRLLSQFATLNSTIIHASATGQDITDSLDQRDGLLTELSRRIGVSVVARPNNDMALYTDSGVTLFETTPRKVTFQETPNLSPGVSGADVYIDGARVTGSGAPLALQSGSILGLVKIRDDIAPQYQTQLDEIARGLIVSYAEQDQSGGGGPALPGLFTYAAATTVPGATLITGLATQITVAAAVDPLQGGSLQKLRDGGISGNPSYVYNASQAPAYAERLIELANAPASIQSFDPIAGLVASGSLTTFAAASNGWIAAQRQQVDGIATYYDQMVSQTTQALSNDTGVNLDEQMSQMLALENAYQASAKLLQVVNSMFDSLFSTLLTHLSESLRNNLAQLLTYKDMRGLIDRLEPEYRRLVDDIAPSLITHSTLQGTLKLLLAERVSIRNLELILEAIAEIAPFARRAEAIVEHVRVRLGSQICSDLAVDGVLGVLRLGPRWDLFFHERMKRDAKGEILGFDADPTQIEKFSSEAGAAIRQRMEQGESFVLLTTPEARPYVRLLLSRAFPSQSVLSHMEIGGGVQIKSLGAIS